MSPDSMYEHLLSLYCAKLFYDYRKLDDAISVGVNEMTDDLFFYYYELLAACADFFAADYDSNYEVDKWYFSNESMVEYYRLCRIYGSAHRMKLKDNPFMKQAERFVEEIMDLSDQGFAWSLNTKVGHKWASGLIFQIDCYFHGELELIEALLVLRAWYAKAVIRLRGILLEERILRLPALPAHKEVAK